MGVIPFWDTNLDGYGTWLYSPNPWDQLSLSGTRIPGVVDSSAVAKLAYNKSKASGKHGARVTFTGYDPGEADVKVYISNPAQWDEWQAVEGFFFAGDRKAPVAVDADSPAFAAAKIKSIAVVSVATPVPGRVPNERVIVMKVHEYSPPSQKKATHTPRGSKAKLRPEFQEGTTAAPANSRQPKPSTSSKTAGP